MLNWNVIKSSVLPLITKRKNPKKATAKPAIFSIIPYIYYFFLINYFNRGYMPVFARTKILIEDHCVTYRPRIEFSYSGQNPQKAYPKLIDILTKDIAIPRENIQEKSFTWDRSGPTESFEASFEVLKNFDKFSYMQMAISMKGSIKPSKELEKEGSVKIVLEGVVRTEYPQDTTWERSFFYEMFRTFWHKVFYRDRRVRYIQQCREWMLTVENEMKSFFNLLPKMGE